MMNISLIPEHEKFIQSQLKNGTYHSPDEVIREALQLLEDRHRAEVEMRVEELRKKIAIGTEQIARGEVFDGEEVFRELEEEIRQAMESKQ